MFCDIKEDAGIPVFYVSIFLWLILLVLFATWYHVIRTYKSTHDDVLTFKRRLKGEKEKAIRTKLIPITIVFDIILHNFKLLRIIHFFFAPLRAEKVSIMFNFLLNTSTFIRLNEKHSNGKCPYRIIYKLETWYNR